MRNDEKCGRTFAIGSFFLPFGGPTFITSSSSSSSSSSSIFTAFFEASFFTTAGLTGGGEGFLTGAGAGTSDFFPNSILPDALALRPGALRPVGLGFSSALVG